MAFTTARVELGAFLACSEDLHSSLARTGPDRAASAHASCQRLLSQSAALQSAVNAAFEERDRRRLAAHLRTKASDRQADLVALAERMHDADVTLGDVLRRSRDALSAAQAASASARSAVPVATVVQYAERVSYSNAAPCGDVAFEGARRQGWYHGWGAPAPQQHLLANSSFALGRPAAEGGSLPPEAEGETSAVEPGTVQPPALHQEISIGASVLPDAPAYTAVDAPSAPRAAAKEVSLGFDSDDSDDES